MDAKLLELLLSREQVFVQRLIPEGAMQSGDSVDVSSNNKFVITAEEVASGKLSLENSQNIRIVPSHLKQKELDRIKRKARFKNSGRP